MLVADRLAMVSLFVTKLEAVEVAKEEVVEAVKEEVEEAAEEAAGEEVVAKEAAVKEAAEEVAEEAAKEEVVAMQDLKCKCFVRPGNVTTLTVSTICVVSGSPL